MATAGAAGRNTVELPALRERARPISLAAERVLAADEALGSLLPFGGLQRGTVVATGGGAALSLALALAAEASRQGSWVAAVSPCGAAGELGLGAAAELGVVVERMVLVGPVPSNQWATVVATVAEAFDLAILGPPPGGSARLGDARRLQARARERGSVLIQAGWPAQAWPDRPDLSLRADVTVSSADADADADADAGGWHGVGEGFGHLQGRRVTVAVDGRRGAGRPRQADLWLPGPDGRVALVAPAVSTATATSARPLSLVQAS